MPHTCLHPAVADWCMAGCSQAALSCGQRRAEYICHAQVVLQRAHNAEEISKEVTQHSNRLADRGLRSLGIARAAGESGGAFDPPVSSHAQYCMQPCHKPHRCAPHLEHDRHRAAPKLQQSAARLAGG